MRKKLFSLPDAEQIIDFEDGVLPDDEVVELIQHGIHNGWVWNMPNFYGTIAEHLLETGECSAREAT